MKLDYAFKTFLDPVSTDVHSSSFHEVEARWRRSRTLQIRGGRRFLEPDIWSFKVEKGSRTSCWTAGDALDDCGAADGRPERILTAMDGLGFMVDPCWHMLEYKQENSGWWQSSKGGALDDG